MDDDMLKETELEDTNVVAYLHYCGLRFTPIQQESGRVAFVVHGDIGPYMDNMYKNADVKVLDFIKCLKAVRSSMFNLRKINEN
jgi:hypothetical protein